MFPLDDNFVFGDIFFFLADIFFWPKAKKKYSAKKKKYSPTNEVTHPTETPLCLWYCRFLLIRTLYLTPLILLFTRSILKLVSGKLWRKILCFYVTRHQLAKTKLSATETYMFINFKHNTHFCTLLSFTLKL